MCPFPLTPEAPAAALGSGLPWKAGTCPGEHRPLGENPCGGKAMTGEFSWNIWPLPLPEGNTVLLAAGLTQKQPQGTLMSHRGS